jgi:hypothetical protein
MSSSACATEVVLNKIGGVLFYKFFSFVGTSCLSPSVSESEATGFRALVGILQLPFGDLSPHIFEF